LACGSKQQQAASGKQQPASEQKHAGWKIPLNKTPNVQCGLRRWGSTAFRLMTVNAMLIQLSRCVAYEVCWALLKSQRVPTVAATQAASVAATMALAVEVQPTAAAAWIAEQNAQRPMRTEGWAPLHFG